MSTRAFLLLAAILCASPALAQSQPPSPRPAKAGQGPQDQTTPALAQPANDQRGTESQPLVVRTTKMQDDAAQKESDREQRSANERWTKALAVMTVAVGVLQLIMIAVQAYIAHGQNKIVSTQSTIMEGQRAAAVAQSGYMLNGLEETRNSISEAAKSTTAMQSIAHSMASSLSAMYQTLETSRKVADINAQAFNAAHRGSLSARPVAVTGIDDHGLIQAPTLTATFRITNTGPTDVNLLYFHTRWHFGRTLPVNNPALQSAEQGSPLGIVVAPGHFADAPVGDFVVPAQTLALFNANAIGISNGADAAHTERLFVFGYVKFTDRIGFRRSYFCYRFNPFVPGLVADPHPAYAYDE